MRSRARELGELAINRDERRKTSDTERARLATLVESMRDAVLVVDAEGRTILRNSAYVSMFERSALRAGLPFDVEALRSRVARGEEFSLPFVAAGVDGRRRWFEAYGRPVPAEMGIGMGGILVVHDTTDLSLRRLEQEFVSIVAHELRTPLTALRGYLQMLARRPGEQNGRLLPLAIEQADRLQAMIDELFDVSRVERGRLSVDPRPQVLGEIIESTIEIVQAISDRHTVRFESAAGEIIADVDRGRIQQVLLNLVMNAFVHAPESSEVDVRLRRLRRRAQIEVEDHGPGIPPEAQATLFEPFEQSGSGRTAPGLGLGLYIAREIVTAHGGTIDVDSAPGEGTTFIIRLPLARMDQRREGTRRSARSSAATASAATNEPEGEVAS